MAKAPNTMNDVGEEIPVRRVRNANGAEQPAGSDPADRSDAQPSATQAVTEAPAPAPDEALTVARERDDYYDRLLRKTAEFDNYRKRVERERREQAEYAAADVLTELLPLMDDMERALGADAKTDAAAYRKGVELIHKQMFDLLRRRGVTPIDAVG